MNNDKLTKAQLDKLPTKFRFFNKEPQKDDAQAEAASEFDSANVRGIRFTPNSVYNTKQLLCDPLFRPTSKIQFQK